MSNVRNEYRTALDRLPIENPTLDDVRSICPYLTRTEVLSFMGRMDSWLACPPIKYARSLQRITISERGERAPTLKFGDAISRDHAVHGSILFPDQAIRAVQRGWKDQLVRMRVQSVVDLSAQRRFFGVEGEQFPDEEIYVLVALRDCYESNPEAYIGGQSLKWYTNDATAVAVCPHERRELAQGIRVDMSDIFDFPRMAEFLATHTEVLEQHDAHYPRQHIPLF